jgi:cytochrome c peroxidase
VYIRSLARWNSPFDRYARGETDALDPAARRGFNLFMGKAACATCHFPPAFNGVVPPRYIETESEVLGVPEKFPATPLVLDPDPGRGIVHLNPIFQNAFKTPTVRNVALTAPYMHNGSMETLEDVMDFYNAGGGAGLGLDVPNQTLPTDSLGLTRREMDDVIAFMKALTDTTGYGAHGVFEKGRLEY